MPCRSDGLAPTEREKDSIQVIGHLKYVLPLVGKKTPKSVKSTDGPDLANLDEHTAFLCEILTEIDGSPEGDCIIYDGKNPKARKLADWWELHQAADRRREEENSDEAKRQRALNKLNADDRKALGLE